MRIWDDDQIWTVFYYHVSEKQLVDEMKKLIIGLCKNHFEDFFNQNFHFQQITEMGESCLSLACLHDNLNVIKYFIEELDPNHTDFNGHTCLELACMDHDLGVII